jgi:lipopolysaccharide export system permease protein
LTVVRFSPVIRPALHNLDSLNGLNVTTFDRYLLRRYLHVFLVFLLSTFGLFVVIDGFSNVDGFQEDKTNATDVMARMADYYLYRSSQFFDMVGPILSVIAVMVVFAMLYKNSELHPLLAAGVPTYRLVVPLLVGTAIITSLLMVNREFVIPRIAHHLRAPRNEEKAKTEDVQPMYDHASKIWIGGAELVRGTNRLKEAEFVLPPGIANDLTPVRSPIATFHKEAKNRPAGWLLHDVQPRRSALHLSEAGEKVLHAMPNEDQLFIATDVSFDQLSNRGQSFSYASTTELVRRVQNPSYGNSSVRSLALHVHSRLMQPMMGFILVFLAIPLIVRKEGRGLVSNIALCTGVMGAMFGVTQLGMYLGKVSLISPSLAAGAPLIISGTLAAWLSDAAQS